MPQKPLTEFIMELCLMYTVKQIYVREQLHVFYGTHFVQEITLFLLA